MPTTWDETRAIGGDFAKWIAVARRSDKTWYVGVMNNGTERDVTLDLSILHAKTRQTYTDGNAPKDLYVGNSTNGSLHLAAGGGALLILQGE